MTSNVPLASDLASVVQPPLLGECARRVRFEVTDDYRHVHVIIEEEDRAGDGAFEDERARVTVELNRLLERVETLGFFE